MKIILNKEDIENIVKEHFSVKQVGWDKQGNLVIDEVLEELARDNDKESETSLNLRDSFRLYRQKQKLSRLSPPF